MEQITRRPSFTNWKSIEILLAVLFLIAPLYYHPNIGGEGLRVPNNITVWMVATIIILYSLHLVLKRSTFVIPKYFGYIAAFPLLITLSGFVTGVEQPLKWLFRLLFIWGGLAFCFSLFQHRLKQGRLDRVLFVIVLSALLQGGVGIGQIWLQAEMPFWLPKSPDGVPSGLFQQINNQATYQVTAIMVSIFLITRPYLTHGKLWKQAVVIIAVACASYVIMISGSRIGMLTLVLGLIIICCSLWHRLKSNKYLLSALFLSFLMGGGAGLYTNSSMVVDKTVAIQSGYSGSARLGMYKVSFDLIKQKPVLGYGIGSFPRVWQYAKPDFYQSHPNGVLPNKFVSHPHNELIFWLVEGGMLVGFGLVLFIIGIALALFLLGWQRGGGYTAILLPVVLHTQVELPFYTSVIHWTLFILLLFIVFQSFSTSRRLTTSAMAIKAAVYTNGVLALIVLLFFAQTMRAQFDFYDFYHSPLTEQVSFNHAYANPYLSSEAQWIEMSSILYSSIELGLHENIRAYIRWGEGLLVEQPDSDLYEKLIDAHYSLGDFSSVCKTAGQGIKLYPEHRNLKLVLLRCQK